MYMPLGREVRILPAPQNPNQEVRAKTMVMALSRLPPYGKPSNHLYLIIVAWEQLESILADPDRRYCSKNPGKHDLVLFASAVEAMIEFISNGVGYFWGIHKPQHSTHASLRAALKDEVPFEETLDRALHYFGILHLLRQWLKDENEFTFPIPDKETRDLIEFLKDLHLVEESG